MKKFEYKREVMVSTALVTFLNNFGQEGWELVSINKISKTYTYEAFFKRELIIEKDSAYFGPG